MRRNNGRGLLEVIVCLLIFVVFAVTLYACLDMLDLIEVPDGQHVSDWIEKIKNIQLPDDEEIVDGENTVISKQNVKIQIEDETDESGISVAPPNLEGYNSIETTPENEKYESEEFSYYNQLDEYGKIIYRELEKNLDNMKSGTYNVKFGTTFDDLLHEETGEQVLNDSFQLAINALNFDNPEFFYIDISKVYLLTKISTKLWVTTYEVEIGASQGQSYLKSTFASEEEVNQAIRQVEAEKSNIKFRLSGSVENHIRGVHDYLIGNLEYDSSLSHDNIYNIYGALVNKYTVCEGYARAFKSIMDDLNIPCLIACGTGINSSGNTESHAWNYVMIDGKWYAIDVTWDDPVIVGNGYISNSINYKYYLKGSNEFFKNHIEDGAIVGNANFKYPTLSLENY